MGKGRGMVKTIEELIEKYNEYILLLEEDIRQEGIGNGFRVGRRSAFGSVVDDLEDLLREVEDD